MRRPEASTANSSASLPLVSVLLPVYNAAATLRRALGSLTHQQYTHWECVLVDDGSSDASLSIARAIAQRDARFRILSEPHRGIVAALNTGLAHCGGEFVARFDADDLLHPARLMLQLYELGAHPELEAVGCHVQLFPRRKLSPNRIQYQRWLNSLNSSADVFADRFVECPVAHPTLMLRTATLRRLGYRDEGWAEDYDLVSRLLQAGPCVGVVPKPLLFWRDHASRLSRTHEVYTLERFVRCKAHFLSESWLRERDSYVLWGYGDTGRSLCLQLLQLGKRPSLIVDVHPGRVGQVIQGVRVVHPTRLPSANLAGDKIVASVAGLKARTDLRTIAAEVGLVEGRDYVVAA